MDRTNVTVLLDVNREGLAICSDLRKNTSLANVYTNAKFIVHKSIL